MYKQIIIIIILIFSIFTLFYYNKHKYLIMKSHDCTNTVTTNLFNPSRYNHGNSWTVNFWFYIDSLNDNYLQKKYILESKNCSIYISKNDNNLIIEIPVIYDKIETLILKDITLQKWVNICIIVENRHIDVWINNKLELSRYATNLPKIENNISVTITRKGQSIQGKLANFKFYNYNIPKYNIFSQSIYSNFKDMP